MEIGKSEVSLLNKLYFYSPQHRINFTVGTYLENSTISVNTTTSDLSLLTVKPPTPMSATPVLTSDTIPFHDPFPVLVPYESVSWYTVLLASVRNKIVKIYLKFVVQNFAILQIKSAVLEDLICELFNSIRIIVCIAFKTQELTDIEQ